MREIVYRGSILVIKVRETFRVNVVNPLRKENRAWSSTEVYRNRTDTKRVFSEVKGCMGDRFNAKRRELLFLIIIV